MEPADLDSRLTRALAQLPSPVAPDSLLPRIRQTIGRGRQPPWYRRAWREWPRTWQALSVGASVTAVALVVGQPGLIPGDWASANVTAAAEPVQRVTRQVEPTVAALQVLWRVFVEPLAPVLLGLVVVMGTACVVIVLALNYLVVGRTWQR